MSTALRAAFALFVMLWAVPGSQAEERAKLRVERANAGTISVIASSLEAPYVNYAQDLADVLDDGNNLRILPIIGKGPVQTLTDLIYLKGVDAGIVPSDVLAYVKNNALFDEASGRRLAYLAKLGSAQVHVVASQGIVTLGQLEGKRINIGRATDDRFVTANVILTDAGINFTADDSDPVTALAMLKAGKLDAVILVEPTPSPYLKAAQGLSLVQVPLSENLKTVYSPALLTTSEYPELLATQGPTETVSVTSVLAVFKWQKGTKRYDKLVKLGQSLYSQIDLLRMPNRHAAWGEVNLAASVPGWERYIAAEEWLAGKLPKPKTTEEEPVASEADFKAFLAESGLPPNTPEGGEDALFERFVKWQQARGELPTSR